MKDIAQNFNYKTPAFIFDLDGLGEHLRFLRANFKGKKLCYAMKANPFLAGFIADFVDKIEVSSDGEFEICKSYGILAHKIFYTGIYKNEQCVKKAWDYGVRSFNAESLNQLEMLCKFGDEARIFIRLSNQNQFGIDKQTLNKALLKYAKNIKGIHYFGGTFRDKKIPFDLEILHEIIKCYDFEELEYGVGLGVKYFINDKFKSEQKRIDELNKMLANFKIKICLEMGRFIVAKYGLYASKVVDIKCNDGINYAILNGGMNHLNYYGQIFGMKTPQLYHFGDGAIKNWCLCGAICSTADVLVKDISLKNLQINDNLFFANAGAYASTEALYLFLSQAMPSIYLYKNKQFILARDEIPTYTLNMKGKNNE